MSEEKRKPTPEEKAKAAAEAKAKAEALRKQRELETAQVFGQAEQTDQEKAAQPDKETTEVVTTPENVNVSAPPHEDTTTAGADGPAEAKTEAQDPAKAKADAAAKAKAAAAAAAKAKAAGGASTGEAEEVAVPKAPSKNQPYLDKYVKVITEKVDASALEDSYINELSKEVPTIVVQNEKWIEVAKLLKEEEQLHFEYLSNLHGVDYEDRMEVYYHLYSYKNRQSLAVKVKTSREQASVPSVTPIWEGARWNERETYDLLGITFTGHQNLRRIMLPDDWVGHPLRKDYVQYDEEV